MVVRLSRQTLAGIALGILFTACGISEEPPIQGAESPGQVSRALWVDLNSSMGTPVVTGNTVNGSNEFAPPASCTDSPGGPDLSFRWKAPQTGSYTLTTAGSLLDTVLHIYTFSTTTLLACNDDASASTLTSSAIVTLNAGEELRIVVDSYSPPTIKGGAFQLNISYTCSSSPGNCFVFPGTWNGSTCVYPVNTGAACNDGNACTTNDVCDGRGTCGGTTITCNAPPSQCYQATGACSSGTCTYVPKLQGTACNDGNTCTTNDVCDGNGTCGGTAIVCNTPPGDCYGSSGTCSNGTCSYPPLPAGTFCEDGDTCTTFSQCSGTGACVVAAYCSCPEGGYVCEDGICVDKTPPFGHEAMCDSYYLVRTSSGRGQRLQAMSGESSP
jgi:hypothetical protein